MLVFLIEIVGVEGVGGWGGGSEARIGERKYSMDGRWKKLGGRGLRKNVPLPPTKESGLPEYFNFH